MRALIALATAAVLTACGHIDTAPQVDVLPAAAPQQLAYPQLSQPAPQTAATGSLFHSASYRPGFEDRRARLVGDVLTVQIVENITASQKSSSSIDRDGSQKAGITALPFLKPSSLGKLNVAASNDTSFSGKGGTESANTFQGSITTQVMQVLPNGHLVVAGEKQIGVNQNVDVLRFSGIVDPRAIQPGSLVASNQVANARISSRGRGQQDEAQAIGWLSRFFLSVSPF